MKKITLILGLAFVSISMFAQTIVSTTAQNKKVVLEEFTGIHCGYCPSGHKISNAIEAAHPNDFFSINIHVGSFSNPGSGEPDFRTQWGTAIAGQSGLTGYPAGTINRHLFAGQSQGSGTAMSRAKWTANTNTTLGQTSYVNIAAVDSINLSTREMKILVEGYFTGSGAPSQMKLNVALLQNNIQGPQSGMASNPSQVLPNGKYNHMHMLRHLITGQWGDTISTTTQGTFFSKTYTYTVPANIKGVPVSLGDLEVIVFLTKTHQEIVTANKAVNNFITPPGVFITDLEVKDLSVVPTLCGTSFTPKIQIKNVSTSVVADSFNVSYTYNGGTAVNKAITNSLPVGDSVVISFPATTVSHKVNKFAYSVDLNSVTHLIDINVNNNSTITPEFYQMPANTMGTVYTEDFESYTLAKRELNHTLIINPTKERAYVVNGGVSTAVTWKLGGFGKSKNCYRFDFYGIARNKVVNIMFEKLDFSGTNHGVKFNYAYAQYTQSSKDKLEILASDDCGDTWTTVWSKAGDDLKTHAVVGNNKRFYPKDTDWKAANLDLSAFDNKSSVIIAFKGTSDFGNCLYIDDINIYNNTTIGIDNVAKNMEVNVYPNPANDFINLDIKMSSNTEVSYSIINNLGQKVMTGNFGVIGGSIQKINTSDLAKGVYMINLVVGNELITEKIIIQ